MPERSRKLQIELPVSLNEHRMLDTAQMADAVRYCPVHLRRPVKAGKFPKPAKIGRRFLWPASVLVGLGKGALGDLDGACASQGAGETVSAEGVQHEARD